MTYRFVRFLGHDESFRPVRPPLPLEDPLAAYAPFTYATRREAMEDCAAEMSRRWAEVAAGKRCHEAVGLNHFIVECRIEPDGRILGGKTEYEFPSYFEAGGVRDGSWDIDLDRVEIERLTANVDLDGWVYVDPDEDEPRFGPWGI